MPKQLIKKVSFNAGEFTPRLYGRTDVSKYDHALETATNCYVVSHGPVIRRPGSKYVAEVKDSSAVTKLIPFQFNIDTAFMMEFGNNYVRFFSDGGVLVDTTDFTNGTFDSDISSWTDNSTGTGAISFDTDHMEITGGSSGVGIAEQSLSLSQGPYTLTCTVAVGDITLNIGTTSGGTEVTTTTLTAGSNTVTFTPSAKGTIYFSFENAVNALHELDTVVLTNTAYEIVSPYGTSDLPDLSWAQFGNTMYFAHPDYAPRKLIRTANTDWAFSLLNPIPEPTYEAGVEPGTTCTPGATTGLAQTFTAGSAAFLEGDIGRQIVNLSGAGRASITGFTSTTEVTCDIVEDFPSTDAIASGDWKIDLSPVTDLTPDGTKIGSIINITSDEPGTSTSRDAFSASDVGKYILLHGGVVQIVKVTNAADIDAEVLKSLSSKDETGNWSLESPTWDATRGYPRAVGIYQERLVFGGTVAQPQTLWFSETSIFDGFGVGPDDDDSIEVQLGSSQVNEVNWFANARDLIVGTSGGEISIDGGSTGTAVTPDSIRQIPRTYFGSTRQVPITIGNEVIFIQDSQRKVRSFRYDFEIDNYRAEDLTTLSEHITSGLLSTVSYAQDPDSIVMAVDEAGDIVAGTYVRDQQVIGWTKWTTEGSYEEAQVIKRGEKDEIWAIVNRTINGSTVRYVELFETGDGSDRTHGYNDSYLIYSDPKTITGITQADPGVVTAAAHGFSNGDKVKLISVGGMTEVENTTYLVANKTTNTFEITDLVGTNIDTSAFTAYTSGGEAHKLVTSITGLDHLEAEVVQVRFDGAASPDKTVSSGSITLGSPAYEVVVGLEYTTTIKTLDLDREIGAGPMHGQRGRWARPILQVYNSAKPTVNEEFLPSRTAADQMDTALPLYTGFLEYGPLDWGNDIKMTITFSDPLPLTLTGIFGAVESGIK